MQFAEQEARNAYETFKNVVQREREENLRCVY